MIDRGKFDVLGIGIDAVDYEGAIARITSAAKAGQPMAISALAVHGVMTGVLDHEHRYRLNAFDMIVPDGQPVRWALNHLHGAKLPDRVYGPTLMQKTCAAAAENDLPIFLYGSTAEILEQLRHNLVEQHPKLRIAGSRPSRFRTLTEPERDEVVREIKASGAAITFVGLGCPRQEVWAYEFRDALQMPTLAVGAAFAFHSGLLSQAPRFFQDRGLEWFYRLVHEPRRLWRRYLYLNPLYCLLLGMQMAKIPLTKLKRFDPARDPRPSKEILYG